MIREPMIVPVTAPCPPLKLPPPITTAAMTFNS